MVSESTQQSFPTFQVKFCKNLSYSLVTVIVVEANSVIAVIKTQDKEEKDLVHTYRKE